jgi:hypothetical protein
MVAWLETCYAMRAQFPTPETPGLVTYFPQVFLFRCSLPRPNSDDEFESLGKKAIKLAKSNLALGLPGCVGRVD